jgi:hypothetical protein
LATGQSTTSHPTLLQCLVLDRKDSPRSVEMGRILIDDGAELNGPLGACASCDNVEVAALLLDRGAAVNGVGFLVDRGADANIRDTKIGGTPAGWAEYGGHLEMKSYLQSVVPEYGSAVSRFFRD